MTGFFTRNGQAKRVLIEAPRRFEVVEIELDARQPQFGFSHIRFP
jgi:hypothetical protein